jgi:outer membrane protein assembly factor BamB
MSGRFLLGACALLCAACAHTGHGETSVILAGSVCSELPQLTAAGAQQPPAPVADSQALVAYVTPQPGSKLVVYDLAAGRARFAVNGSWRSRPQLLRDLVVAVDERDGQDKLVAYDLQTGTQRAEYPVPRESFLGAVQAGDELVFTSTSLSFRPSERGSTLTALIATSGGKRWERSVPYALSKPSVAAGRVYVISDHADVWALEAGSGDSVGCARLGSEPVEWLQAHGDKLLLGTQAARAIQLSADAPSELGRLQLPTADLPGQPLLQPSAYQSVPAVRSAYGRVALAAPLEAGAATAAPSIAGGRYYYSFYKHLFAFEPSGELRWVHRLTADSAALSASNDAVRVVSESGQVLWYGAEAGALLARVQLPDQLTSADITLGSTPPSSALAAATTAAPSMQAELRALALDTDARLLPSRKLAVSALASSSEPAASRDLLDVYTQPAAPSELQKHVARVLAQRRTGSEHLVAALDGDYNFLTGTPAPPLAAIVPGLITNQEQRAVPRLIDRLFDPDTRLPELHLLVDAVAKLGGKDANKPLAEFLALYHADTSLSEDVSSLLAAAEALAEHSGELAVIEAVSKDPSTLPAVKDRLAAWLATRAPAAPQEAVASQTETATEAEQPPVLERLNDATISSVFTANAGELRECIGAELARNSGLRALRFHFVVESSGKLSRFSVWPKRAQLSECLQPKLEQLRFPTFARGRRLASYTLARRSDATRDEEAKAEGDNKPFWFAAQLRGVGAPSAPEVSPWWQNQNPLYLSVEEAPKPASQADAKQAPVESQPKPAAESDKPAAAPAPAPEEKPAADQWWVPSAR